jgi:acetyl esterase/lipase
MVMGRRPDVPTAPLPVAAVDTVLLGQQMFAALLRVPFRDPLHGDASIAARLGQSVTREVVRSFMGYASSLPIDEFRSIEMMLDDVCRLVMPRAVARFGVQGVRVRIGGVPGILYRRPATPPAGFIVYLHGGGYIGTSPTMYAFFTARLCRETNCAVFVADYRLAPEFPFPAGVEDADAVLAALAAHGVPSARTLVAGDSGGGGLANSLLLIGPERTRRDPPAGVILISPEVDLLLDEPSVSDNAQCDILPWNIPTSSYLHGIDPASALVDADNADLTHYPPAFVTWGADEMFRDPIRRFVKQLAAAGVDHDAYEAEGMFHVFPILMPWAESSQRVYRAIAAFVGRILAAAPPGEWDPVDLEPPAAVRR